MVRGLEITLNNLISSSCWGRFRIGWITPGVFIEKGDLYYVIKSGLVVTDHNMKEGVPVYNYEVYLVTHSRDKTINLSLY